MEENLTADRVEELEDETPEEEETSSTITKELQLFIPQSFTKTFFGRQQNISLLCWFDFSKNSDHHLLRFCFKKEEDNQQKDALFDLINKSFCYHFTSNLNLNNTNIIKTPPIPRNQWQHFKEFYCCKHDRSTRQHGSDTIFLEGDEEDFYVSKPDYPSKGNPGCHVEEKLIGSIRDFLEKNKKKGPKMKFILIYTYNSPCFKRKKMDTVGCMFQLLKMAHDLHSEYGILTYVLFTKYWGPIGEKSKFLKDLIDLHQQYHITFPLDKENMTRNLNKIKKKQLLSGVEHINKIRLGSDFQNAKDHLIGLTKSDEALTTEQHLVRGENTISLLKGQGKIYDSLLKSWQDGVEDSFKKHLKVVCNTAIVKCFIENLNSILGNSSPIKFYQIPQSLLM